MRTLQKTESRAESRAAALPNSVLIACWFGVITGVVEGLGLLAFQRINWADWGPTLHVSGEIVWIATIVDICFFCLLALAVSTLARIVPRIPPIRATIFVLTTAAVYDWLALTARLYRLSCILLAIGVAAVFTTWANRHKAEVLRFCRRNVFVLPITLLLAFVATTGRQRWTEKQELSKLPAAANSAPNVLIVVIDTLRADHLSSYGYERPTTPNLDQLASQGVQFQNAISPASWSFPSHVSLVTGKYQFQHGFDQVPPMRVFGSGPHLGPNLPAALEHKGYRTGAFSANRLYFSRDLGFGPEFIHFDDYFHSPADMFVRTLYGREFDRIYLVRSEHSKPKRLLRWLGWNSLLDPDAEGWGDRVGALGIRKRASVVNAELLDWLDHTPKRPFFAFLNYFDVHGPYGGPQSYPKPGWPQTTDVDRYDDGVKYVDDNFGALLQGLRRRGLLDNTLVVVTSDHGESLWQHGLPDHGRALYRELIHVPLIFWYPGHLPEGVKIETPISNAAIASTVMDLLGYGSQDFTQVSLTPLWTTASAATSWPPPLSELAQNKYEDTPDIAADKRVPTSKTGYMKSLFTAQWQLIVHEKQPPQLYAWPRDPGENNDLAQSPGARTAYDQLSSALRDILRPTSATTRDADSAK